MAYVICAYYTVNTLYEEDVKKLEASLKKFNLPYELTAIPDLGNHQANVHFKPYFIKQMLNRHFPKDVIYVDADAIVQQPPSFFNTFKGDVGVVYLEKFGHELLGGTLYFANNAKAMEIIERWIAYLFEFPLVWDQKVLQYVIEQSNDLNLNLIHLPPAYCQIFDLMKEFGPPVIEHFQASRRNIK